jgi:(methylthio)acryloyl-CoA hydratase
LENGDEMAEGDHQNLLRIERDGPVLIIGLDRPEKRNALNDETIASFETVFSKPPTDARAVLLHATGPNFSAGLDLSEIAERNVHEGVLHSRSWHQCFEKIEFGSLPVVAVLRGAVVGGGLELAAATHVRVAERSTFYALPEGQRGIFVGGGGSVRIPRLIGVSRMADMMLTGRVYGAEEGLAVGLSQYVVEAGKGLDKAFELATRIAGNAQLSNFAVMHALPRIAEMGPDEGLFTESLMAAIAQGDDAAKSRMRDFLDGNAAKVKKA